MPISLVLQLLFQLDVAVGSVPDPGATGKVARNVGNLVVGGVKAVTTGNPAQFLQGLSGLAGSALEKAERMYANFYRTQLLAFILRPHRELSGPPTTAATSGYGPTTMSGGILLGELARTWRALADGSHRWEIQGSFVCMLTEIIMCLAEGQGGTPTEATAAEAMSKDDAEMAAMSKDHDDVTAVSDVKGDVNTIVKVDCEDANAVGKAPTCQPIPPEP